MNAAPSSSPAGAARRLDPAADGGAITLDEIPTPEDHDALLPFHRAAAAAPKPQPASGFAAGRPLLLFFVWLGFFLAACPLPRKYLSGLYTRRLLITLVASLTTFPSLRGRLMNRHKRLRRVLMAYAGFYLSMYALFGAADEVRVELHWRSSLWYQLAGSLQLGYLSRLFLAAAGFSLQKFAGIHSAMRILATYLLCVLWMYIDVPLTIFDMARGREYW
ncbi:hypothetical protein GQ53DRAFT_746231 [Thozetella sp. PMI_491]|nr:hypothetical protein GQ53DRAFT_746231 [Thozetella sp. PMI_491]